MHFTVIMEASAAGHEVDAVERVLWECGIEGDVTPVLERKAADSVWVIYLSAPLGIFLAKFAVSAGTAAGKKVGDAVGDALVRAGSAGWQRLKGLVEKLYAARRASSSAPGEVILRIEEVVEIVVPEGLAEAAWRQLVETDIEPSESGLLSWDSRENRWRDAWSVRD